MPSRSLENYPRDIVNRVIDDFDADAISCVHLLLEDLGSDRLSRCALFMADGSISGLENAVALGKLDPRDLIYSAEYECAERQLRDFNLPFPEKK